MAVYESKNPTKDGRKYFFRVIYKDVFGEKHDYTSPKFKKRSDAVQEEAIFRTQINDKVSLSSITIENAFYELLKLKTKNVKSSTLVRIKYHFKYLEPIKNIKINDINLTIYNKWISFLDQQNLGNNYKNKILGLFTQIINYSYKYYNTQNQILKFLEKYKENEIKKEMDFFTLEEFKQYEAVIEDFEWKTFFEVLYYMGLRQGEVQALTWKEINFENGTLTVKQTLTTKLKGIEWQMTTPKTKSSIRTLPIKKDLLESLKTMNINAKKYKDYKDSWFVFGNSLPFKETTIQLRKNKYCKLANVKQIRIHDFRHSCASLLINQGASITLVSKYLGHSKISMTLNTYTHLYKSELDNIVNLINNI